MNLYYFFLLLTLSSFDVSAQEVIATAGEFGTSSEGSLSWTLGEVVSETVSTPDFQLTQGFQQVQEGFLGLSNESNSNDLFIYPNPFNSEVNVVTNDLYGQYSLIIFDYQTKIILERDILFSPACNQMTLNLSMLPAGFYYVELTSPADNKQYLQPLIKL